MDTGTGGDVCGACMCVCVCVGREERGAGEAELGGRVGRRVAQSGRGLGHLPGTLVEKINPYLIPILEEMNQYLTKNTVETYRSRDIIESPARIYEGAKLS